MEERDSWGKRWQICSPQHVSFFSNGWHLYTFALFMEDVQLISVSLPNWFFRFKMFTFLLVIHLLPIKTLLLIIHSTFIYLFAPSIKNSKFLTGSLKKTNYRFYMCINRVLSFFLIQYPVKVLFYEILELFSFFVVHAVTHYPHLWSVAWLHRCEAASITPMRSLLFIPEVLSRRMWPLQTSHLLGLSMAGFSPEQTKMEAHYM